MNPGDKSWLENRINAAVADDSYMDRDEEKRIKEEGSSRGILVSEIELVLRTELDKIGAVCERTLVDELDRLMHQFTDNDRYLDAKEERDALDKVLTPARGKKVGLDPRVAKEYVDSFCNVNGVKRSADVKARTRNIIIGVLAAGFMCVAAFLWLRPVSTPKAEPGSKVAEKVVDSSAYTLSPEDREEIDQLLRKASLYVDQGQYTDPPEKSAKSCLDRMRTLDPKGQYKGEEIKSLVQRILEQYFALAKKSSMTGDNEASRKWLDRASLFQANRELIREKEVELGLVKTEGNK